MLVGCQTYTWEMFGNKWTGRVDDILAAIAKAGYTGIEITNSMIREYDSKPVEFASALQAHGLALAGFAYASPLGFTDPVNRPHELEGADKAIRFLTAFPGVRLLLGGPSTPVREKVNEKIAYAAGFYNEVGQRAKLVGIEAAFHPHSHHGSILESSEEYSQIMALTDPGLVHWNPDTGHIVRGGQKLLDTLKRFSARIRHVHLKDVDANNRWQPLGQGICDIPAVLKLLEEQVKFPGWLVAEEESEAAWAAPKNAIALNRQYLKTLGY
jgi:inosose dehydratase